MGFLGELIGMQRVYDALDRIESTLKEMKMTAAQNADQLAAKLQQIGNAVGNVATVIGEARTKLAEQAKAIEELKAGNVSPEVLAALNASADASLDQLARIVAPVVADPEVPTGEVPVPPETNPETPAPETVPIPPEAPPVVTEPSAVSDPPAENPGSESAQS